MATAAAKPAPRVLTFLKHGVVIPARRCGLFLQVFALSVALSMVPRLYALYVVAPLAAAADADFHRVTRRDDDVSIADPAARLKSFAWDHKWLMVSGAGYLALYLAAGLVTKVATVSAAVASCSGERQTSAASFLRRARGDLLPGLATAALGCVLKAACAGAGAAAVVAMPLIVYWCLPARLLLLAALLALVAFHFYFYLDAVCTVAVVSSAAEPGGRRGGAGAVARAWRLMRGATARALVYVAVTWALGEAVGPARDLAVRWLLPLGAGSDGELLVKASVEYVLHFAVQVFAIAAITAHYFECRESTDDDKAGHVD
ncbi:hypothetical protein ACP70R_023617 [Stipagrostis hirtigluma subsp. patula]